MSRTCAVWLTHVKNRLKTPELVENISWPTVLHFIHFASGVVASALPCHKIREILQHAQRSDVIARTHLIDSGIDLAVL